MFCSVVLQFLQSREKLLENVTYAKERYQLGNARRVLQAVNLLSRLGSYSQTTGSSYLSETIDSITKHCTSAIPNIQFLTNFSSFLRYRNIFQIAKNIFRFNVNIYILGRAENLITFLTISLWSSSQGT